MSALNGVLPDTLLVHTAQRRYYAEPQTTIPEWIEGEPGVEGGGEPTLGPVFACVLFLPSPGGAQPNPYRTREVRQPQILYNPAYPDGTAIVVSDEDELMVTAPELAPWTGAETVRWLADGDPQPFGPPGSIYGILAMLQKVED